VSLRFCFCFLDASRYASPQKPRRLTLAPFFRLRTRRGESASSFPSQSSGSRVSPRPSVQVSRSILTLRLVLSFARCRSIYYADQIAQVVVSAGFLVKIVLNIFESARTGRSKWSMTGLYMALIMALVIGTAIAAGGVALREFELRRVLFRRIADLLLLFLSVQFSFPSKYFRKIISYRICTLAESRSFTLAEHPSVDSFKRWSSFPLLSFQSYLLWSSS